MKEEREILTSRQRQVICREMCWAEPLQGKSFDVLGLRGVVDHWRIHSVDLDGSFAFHGRCNVRADLLNSFANSIKCGCIIRSYCALHKCLVREDVIGVARREVANSEDEVLAAINVPRGDRV